MKMLSKELFELYYNNKITYNEFVNRIVDVYERDEDCILRELYDAYNNMSPDSVDCLIYTLFILDDTIKEINISKYLDILEKLLISDWHSKNEDIVQLLEKISSLDSLDYFFQAIDLKPDYLSWDDNYAFEKKCVYAIAKIGKDKSFPYLKKLCCHDNKVICECAEKQIKKLKSVKLQNNEVRANFTDETIRVYQAYNKLIATEAIQKGTFGNHFKLDRMTWIKPSFLWMMYRCGWASKENQEFVLAIDIKREGFDFLVKNAVSSKYREEIYGSQVYWKYKMRHSDVICQWDPERDIYGNPLDIGSIQLGLRGNALKKYVQEWIVSITDITDYVLKLKKMMDNKQNITDLLPKESIYQV